MRVEFSASVQTPVREFVEAGGSSLGPSQGRWPSVSLMPEAALTWASGVISFNVSDFRQAGGPASSGESWSGRGEVGMIEGWSYRTIFIFVCISRTLSLRSCCECISIPPRRQMGTTAISN